MVSNEHAAYTFILLPIVLLQRFFNLFQLSASNRTKNINLTTNKIKVMNCNWEKVEANWKGNLNFSEGICWGLRFLEESMLVSENEIMPNILLFSKIFQMLYILLLSHYQVYSMLHTCHFGLFLSFSSVVTR